MILNINLIVIELQTMMLKYLVLIKALIGLE